MLNILSNEVFMQIAATAPTGGAVHQELNFGMLLEPKLRKLFYETYDEVPEQYSKLFHVQTSKKAKETDYGLGAMGAWNEFGSSTTAVAGATAMPSVEYVTIPSGLERTYVHKEFARGFMIERKFADDEMYNVIEKMPKDLARAGRYKVENDAIALFNNAFSADTGGVGKSAIYDGKPLIAADHPTLAGGTVSNLVTGALADTTLKNAIILGQSQKDEAGKLIQMNFDTLVVPPSLQFLAEELLKSPQKSGTNVNDINSLKDAMKVVVNPFLTDTDAWYIMDSKRHQLNFFWRVKPEFKREEDFDTLVAKYRGYMRYSFGCSDFRGIIGSAGV
jgi:phage major head subunit gpT-like protein